MIWLMVLPITKGCLKINSTARRAIGSIKSTKQRTIENIRSNIEVERSVNRATSPFNYAIIWF